MSRGGCDAVSTGQDWVFAVWLSILISIQIGWRENWDISLNFNVLSINLTILDPTPYTVPLRVLQVAFWVVFNVVWDGILGVGFLVVFSGAMTVLTGWE